MGLYCLIRNSPYLLPIPPLKASIRTPFSFLDKNVK
nr:MAG TPA: hypothetical protein [Caudoviricetes sp.]DAY49076.1 MAG TPA: hypothetical protein [Caudoviricetes sp.]